MCSQVAGEGAADLALTAPVLTHVAMMFDCIFKYSQAQCGKSALS